MKRTRRIKRTRVRVRTRGVWVKTTRRRTASQECYVCKGIVPLEKGLVYVGNNKYRHKNCEPFSKEWYTSNIGHKLLKEMF